ncbi:MAG: hypothetical protein MI750_08600 [Xanthomonadales bacterium]|nr:hypothetical protein [Xanthomonadales bacterium]
MNRTEQRQQIKASVLGVLMCTGSFAASAADDPVINWLSPHNGQSHTNAPLAIVISQPAPSLVFSNNSDSTRVKLAFTSSPSAANSAPQSSLNFSQAAYSIDAANTISLHDNNLSSQNDLFGLHSRNTIGNGLAANNTLAQSNTDNTSLAAPTWSVTVEVEQQLAQSLAAIGQIHCEGGYFSPSGYTASGCSAAPLGQSLRLGGSFSPASGVEFGLGIFDQQSNSGALSAISPVDQGLYNAALLASPLAAQDLQPRQGSGFDMDLHLNTSEFSLGRFQMDVAIAEYFGQESLKRATAFDFNPPWLSTNDLQRQARLHLGWSKGAFSGGVEGIHQVYQPGALATPSNDWNTFNLYFSWQAPWSGRFSIGATNVLDTSLEDTSTQQPDTRQPLDGIFGRVPYVRYKHDL